ncbi:hypothetical protein LTR22_009131 [Elasticomyces elasticus]|nr:hypothetical protein LTR22_009131 [Elasticomyces elasticus]
MRGTNAQVDRVAYQPTYKNDTACLQRRDQQFFINAQMQPFAYLVPALYLNGSVTTVLPLGNLSTGSQLSLGTLVEGEIRSEPGFEPALSGKVKYGYDYTTDDGSTPIELTWTGIQYGNAELASQITADPISSGKSLPYGSFYSIFNIVFRGGDAKYKDLQNYIYVGAEAVSDSDTPSEFLVGVKVMKVVPRKTNVTIGHEFP